jgi:hypothetical protein
MQLGTVSDSESGVEILILFLLRLRIECGCIGSKRVAYLATSFGIITRAGEAFT